MKRARHFGPFRLLTAITIAAAMACAPPHNDASAAASKSAPAQPSPAEANPAPPANPPTPQAGPGVDTRCDLAQGSDSQTDVPFVAVIRDEATYKTLVEKIHPKVPALQEHFLPAGLVVAAFLGPKPTAGYTTTIRRDGNVFRVGEQAPPKNTMVAQVITTPFAIAAFPEAPDAPVLLDLGASNESHLLLLGVRSGSLTVAGGIAGTSATWKLAGTVRVSTFDTLATLLLDLTAASEQGTKDWKGALTVTPDRTGAFEGLLWDASPLVPAPCKALAVQGTLDTTLGKLALRFAPGPCKGADAFVGKGELEATYEHKPAAK